MFSTFKESNKQQLLVISYVVGGVFALYMLMCVCSTFKGRKGNDSKNTKQPQPHHAHDNEITPSKPMFYFSPSCPHCVKQKSIIDDASMGSKFEYINCKETPEKCKGVSGVPMFSKNDEKLVGLQTAEKLQSFINS